MKVDEEGRERAGRYVMALLHRRRKDAAWLMAVTDLSPDTISDFLSGKRWPRVETRQRIEDALDLERGEIVSAVEGLAQASDMDPVEAAIEASSALSRGQKLRLRAEYVDMLESTSENAAG